MPHSCSNTYPSFSVWVNIADPPPTTPVLSLLLLLIIMFYFPFSLLAVFRILALASPTSKSALFYAFVLCAMKGPFRLVFLCLLFWPALQHCEIRGMGHFRCPQYVNIFKFDGPYNNHLAFCRSPIVLDPAP